MGINGITIREETLSHEVSVHYAQAFAAGQLAVFGAERLAMDESSLPSSEEVHQLTWQIEELCTGPGATRLQGICYRALQTERGRGDKESLQLSWNPAGIVGGFAPDLEWDRAIATIRPLREEVAWKVPQGHTIPRPYRATESLFIDRISGAPRIRRTLAPALFRHGRSWSSSKLANVRELNQASYLLAPLLKEDSSQNVSRLPIYLEVGYGLDPMTIRGNRNFNTKAGLEIDRAVGSYANPLGSYPEAVWSQSLYYAGLAAREKAGQHILFIIGGGESSLPLHSKSVREIFMSNVLNASIAEELRQGALKEALRVIEPSGNFVQRVNWHQDEWPRDRMVRLLRDASFSVIRSVDHNDPEYQTLEAQYGTPSEVVAPKGYYLIGQPHID